MTTSDRWHTVQRLVDGALDLPPAERSAFLDRECAGDESLRREAARLLDACDRAASRDGLFTTPAVAFAAGMGILAERYALERELGRGGMATVYLARDLRHDRDVAVKVLEPQVDPIGAERFLREIHIAARLTHPHVLGLYDSGATEQQLFYVMPYVEGETLRAHLARDNSLPLGEVVRLLRELTDALAYAHRHGVVHRDLKPENILIAEGHAVVADFGIAKAIAVATETRGSARATLTGTGVAVGTPAYMAPEQAIGDAGADHRVDLYSLGVIAYELLAGRHPFAGRTAQAVVAAHLTETPTSIVEVRRDVPSVLSNLVMRLLAKNPSERPQSAEEVLDNLQGFATGPRSLTQSTTRKPAASIIAAGLVLIGVVVLAAYLRFHRSVGTRAALPTIHTIAVIPFKNTSGSHDDDYFSDGLTDELAHALAGIPGLRVAGRTSSYAFKGKSPTAREIGRALGVDAFVDGTVRRAGKRLRITTQLVNGADGTVLADSAYEREIADVFTVQDELTRSIVAAIAPALSGNGGDSLHLADVKRGTADEEAYELYLKGHYYFMARGAANLDLAATFFRQAIARDPKFARAFAGLSMTYGVLPNYVPDPADTLMSLAKTTAEQAIALDSTLGEAHGALAPVLGVELKFREALSEMQKFVALDPMNVTAHHWIATAYMQFGRDDEAIAELARARELDPLAPSVSALYVVALTSARRFAEAISAGNRLNALDSTFHYTILGLGIAQVFAGQADSAIVTFQRGMRFHGDDSRIVGGLMLAYAAAGRWADADRIRQSLKQPGADQFDGIQAQLGDLLFGDREPLIRVLTSDAGLRRFIEFGGWIGCNPQLDPLWADARFREKMASLHVPPCPRARPLPLPSRPH